MARQSAKQIERELDIVQDLLLQYPEGIGRADLERAYRESQGRELAPRTLLRRLDRLVDEYRARVSGVGPGTKYVAVPLPSNAGEPDPDYIPLSPDGTRVRMLVRRSAVHKDPVGYDPGLLHSYRPGRTWYLPPALREQLHERGVTPDPKRPAGTFARDILDRLLIDLSWASSRLEGNTYSRLDTLNLIEFGQQAEGRDHTEALMILNHKAAIEYLVDDTDQLGYNRYTLLALHSALSENLLTSRTNEGRLRTRPVGISGSPYIPLAIPQKIEEYFDTILEKATAIPDPFEQSFFVMVHLPYLQPFIDVNKRTSRLAANISLVKANLCPLSFVDVPPRAYVDGLLGVYEFRRIDLLRDVFIWAYERSCAEYVLVRESLVEPDPYRLRYRTELANSVKEMILGGHAPQLQTLRELARTYNVPAEDTERFATLALEQLLLVHEYSVGRYRIRPEQYRAWREKFPPAGGGGRVV